jgi:predicted transglutaminase-like cysteine proteinase
MRFLWGILVGAVAAVAVTTSAMGAESQFERELSATKPPVGFVKFCVRNPGECQPGSATIFSKRLNMTPELWDQAFQVNAYVNETIKPISDESLYGETEYWTYPVDAGDCEDYVLLKKKKLMQLGFAAEALLITVVLDEKREGHAVLTLSTTAGDFILDNRRNDILRWSDVDYTYLKRQSGSDPLDWALLSKQAPASTAVSAKGEGK